MLFLVFQCRFWSQWSPFCWCCYVVTDTSQVAHRSLGESWCYQTINSWKDRIDEQTDGYGLMDMDGWVDQWYEWMNELNRLSPTLKIPKAKYIFLVIFWGLQSPPQVYFVFCASSCRISCITRPRCGGWGYEGMGLWVNQYILYTVMHFNIYF